MNRSLVVGVLSCALGVAAANAQTLEETFTYNPFGQWNQNWFYQNTNAENYYVASGNCDINNRGNNPQGLWIAGPQGCGSGVGGPTLEINFDPNFAQQIRSLRFGLEAFVRADVIVYDTNNNEIARTNVSGGGFDFDHATIVSASSNIGISRFVFDSRSFGGGQIEGNTSIDNIIVTIIPAPHAGMIALAGLGLAARRRR